MNMLFLLSSVATPPMIIDGRAIAKDILAKVRTDVAQLDHVPVVRAITVMPSPATESYLSIKARRAKDAGMILEIVRLSDTAGEAEIIEAIHAKGADAVIVQLPLPPDIHTPAVLAAIPLEQDADVLSREARAVFEAGGEDVLLPPVVGAVKEILTRTKSSVEGLWVMVLGHGWLVGQPVAIWLRQQNPGRLDVLAEESDYRTVYWDVDVLVSGVGKPHLITPEKLTKGTVIIDAGTSESDGAIVGDADPACAEQAAVFTPVPGGVGPIAVACLYQNVALLALRKTQKTPTQH